MFWSELHAGQDADRIGYQAVSIRSSIEIPAGVRGVLLDIEGTTSSISFVHDVMFPFVREHLSDFLHHRWHSAEMDKVRELMAKDDGQPSWDAWLESRRVEPEAALEVCQQRIIQWMDADAKITGLKHLQGLIWDSGFKSGQLRAHVYPDVLPAIKQWRERGLDVRIYSSGSIAAQKLFFGHLAEHGNVLDLFSGHYDTTIGGKREAASYQNVASDWGLAPTEIIFVSDLEPELAAASAAGLHVVASVRPGNAPLPAESAWPSVSAF